MIARWVGRLVESAVPKNIDAGQLVTIAVALIGAIASVLAATFSAMNR